MKGRLEARKGQILKENIWKRIDRMLGNLYVQGNAKQDTGTKKEERKMKSKTLMEIQFEEKGREKRRWEYETREAILGD